MYKKSTVMKKIDWEKLPFGYHKTDYNFRCFCKNGKWGRIIKTTSETLELHIASTSLHYGQEVFEGLKAYMGRDGKIRLFRWQENLKRMNSSSKAILMDEIPEKIFEDMIKKAVKSNKNYIPPYGTGATLYIRPLLVGISSEVGVKPSHEQLFIVFVTPVGPYFKDGFNPVNVIICRDYDRAAPLGTGRYKVGGNYAASLASIDIAKKKGYTTALYLDPKEKKYIDECGQANFFAIRNNTYITPESESILPSITNMSLMELAKDIGMKVERRPVPIEELSTFEEVGFCGTATIISSVKKITDPDNGKEYKFCKNNKPGPYCIELYNKLTSIQFGDAPDKFKWIDFV